VSTTLVKKEAVKHNWWVIDATDRVVGRLAVTVANLLRGKHRPDFTPHVDTGDFVVIINAEKVKLTGKKWDTKSYVAFSHYPGGLRTTTAKEYLDKRPEYIIEAAVKRMMPKNRLARQQFAKLKVYAGNTHPHQAQQPQAFKLPE
jgi:large subunit ribosomal protein L13